MIAVLCILLPAVLLNIGRFLADRRAKTNVFSSIGKRIVITVIDEIVLNGSMIFILFVFFHNWGKLCVKLNTYSAFAMKYFLLSMAVGLALVLLKKYAVIFLEAAFRILHDRKAILKFVIPAGCLLILVFSVMFVYFDNYRTVTTETIENTEPYGQITKGQSVAQEIVCDRDGLKDIKLYLATYARINHCTLTATLSFEGTIVQTWEIECRQLSDNAYYTLMLDQVISDSRDQSYYLELTSDGEEGNAVTVYKNSSGDYTGLFVNGEAVSGEALCYQLQYQTQMSRAALFYVIRFLAVCLIIFAAWTALQVRPASVVKAFLVLWIPLSLLYTYSNTLFNVPDEGSHFCRAYEISLGYMLSDFNEESNAGGRNLPLNVDLNTLKTNWQSYESNKTMELMEEWVFKNFSNIALYAPVSYIPQAIGIFIARHISSNIAFIAYMGRLVNWLCITLVLCISMKLLPYGKEFLALIALMPMNIHEAVSLAPDGMVVALSAFIIAFVLYLKECQREKLKKHQIILLYTAAICISLYKIVYLPFCLFYILIPAKRFRHGLKTKLIHAGVVIVSVCTCSLTWLKLCSKFLVHAGTNSAVQLSYLLAHPFQYYVTVIRTAMNSASTLLFRMVGDSLAWLNVATVGLFVLLYLIYLSHKAHGTLQIAGKEQISLRLVAGTVVCSVILLIFTSLYLQWTAVYNNSISGLQGRYFISLLLPAYLFVTKDHCVEEGAEVLEFKSQWLVLLINLCACASLLFACLG